LRHLAPQGLLTAKEEEFNLKEEETTDGLEVETTLRISTLFNHSQLFSTTHNPLQPYMLNQIERNAKIFFPKRL